MGKAFFVWLCCATISGFAQDRTIRTRPKTVAAPETVRQPTTSQRKISFRQIGKVNHNPNVTPEYYDVFRGRKDRIYLDGLWRMDRGPWTEILIPNHIDRARPAVPQGTLVLSRDFEWSGIPQKRLVLFFEGVAYNPVVRINGEKVAEYHNLVPGAAENFSTDITDVVRKGKNTVTVSFDKKRPLGRHCGYGIYAPVYINIYERIYAPQILVTGSLPDRISVKADIINTTGRELEKEIAAIIKPWKGRSSRTVLSLGRKQLRPGRNGIEFAGRVRDAVLWDVDNPFLYSISLCADGKEMGLERFGIREFKIRDGEFHLNGRPFKCMGIAGEEGTLGRIMGHAAINTQFFNNGNNLLRKYFENLKKANVNVGIRFPWLTTAMCDLADEIGLLLFPTVGMWVYLKDLPDGMEERLLKPGYDYNWFYNGIFYKSDVPIEEEASKWERKKYRRLAKPLPKEAYDMTERENMIREYFRHLGAFVRNKPSVVGILPMTENFMSANQGFDLPLQRAALHDTAPGMLLAGCHGMATNSWNMEAEYVPLIAEQDFMNFAHGAAGGSTGWSHWGLFPYTLEWCAQRWCYKNYKKKIPIFADETLFYGILRSTTLPQLWQLSKTTFASMRFGKSLDMARVVDVLGKPDVTDFFKMDRQARRKAQREAAKGKWQWWRTTIQLVGLQDDYLDKKVANRAVAEYTKRCMEQVRIRDQYMQGIGVTTGPFCEYDLDKLRRLDDGAIGGLTRIGESFRHVFAPVFCCLNLYETYSSAIAGSTLELDLYAFNNSSRKIENLVCDVRFGGVVQTVPIRLDGKPKATRPVRIAISGTTPTGDYAVKLVMKDDERILCENSYTIYVLGRADMKTTPDPGRLFVLGKADSPLAGILAATQTQAEFVSVVPAYEEGAALVIAPGAIAHVNPRTAKAFASAGGKILVMEQKPFDNQLLPGFSCVEMKGRMNRVIPKAIGINLMIAKPDHPAFSGIAKRHHWFSFNNRYGEIYSTLIGPLDVSALAIGASPTGGGQYPVIGTLLMEKDNVTWSQVEAVRAAERGDGVATKYIVNLLNHVCHN